MPGDQTVSQRIKEEAKRLGFTMVGIVHARPSRNLFAYQQWLAAEMHGEMGYLARPDRQIRRENLNVILPAVKSMICVGLDYHTSRLPDSIAQDPSRGRISNYAWGVDYHDLMTPKLKKLARFVASISGEPVQNRVYVDTGAILERDHAREAGFGFTGKNTMLIHPRRGSWFFLGELLTTLELPPDEMSAPLPSCGSCQRCLADCPTNAFPKPYVLDARRCISYLTIELKGWIPDEFRPLMGNWIYGCDVCQDVCPFNRFEQATAEQGFAAASPERAAPLLLELLSLTQAQFDRRFAGSPIKRIKRDRLLRNVCVAVGNWSSPVAIPHLQRLLIESSALVRGHAIWALGQMKAPAALEVIKRHASVESDAHVILEIKKAAQI